MKFLTKINFKATGVFIGALGLLITMVHLGQKYTDQCIKVAGKAISPEIVKQCWHDGLAISGLGVGGQLTAAAIGLIVGTANKEQEKQQKFEEGYWKYNPELHKENQDEIG